MRLTEVIYVRQLVLYGGAPTGVEERVAVVATLLHSLPFL